VAATAAALRNQGAAGVILAVEPRARRELRRLAGAADRTICARPPDQRGR
jgi:predicted phosphoribosyltransferase